MSSKLGSTSLRYAISDVMSNWSIRVDGDHGTRPSPSKHQTVSWLGGQTSAEAVLAEPVLDEMQQKILKHKAVDELTKTNHHDNSFIHLEPIPEVSHSDSGSTGGEKTEWVSRTSQRTDLTGSVWRFDYVQHLI